MSHFTSILTIDTLLMDCEAAAGINAQNDDELADIRPFMRALETSMQTGHAYVEPPTPKTLIVRASRSWSGRVDLNHRPPGSEPGSLRQF
jgi:hypothetical protein